MSAALVDHLWQSWLCLIASVACLPLLRRAPALVRLWLWRVAALKFLLPFAWLNAFGHWVGFPVFKPDGTAPGSLVHLLAALKPLLAPAQSAALQGLPALALLLFLLAISLAWSVAVKGQLHIELLRARWEADGAAVSGEFPPGIGFFKACLLTSCALSIVGGTVLSGAVDDRQHRHAVLEANLRALRHAKVAMSLARPGMGERARLLADARGVLLRNVNVQEIIAFAYGVNRFAVMNTQFTDSLSAEPRDFWMFSPRYDVYVTGSVREPEIFESYALHAVLTRVLVQRFGLEIHVNGECQRPCGRWDPEGLD